MKIEKTLLALLVLVLAFGGCAGRKTVAPMPDADIVVAADGSGDYRTIGRAIDAADDGDVILVRPGRYEEEVEVEDVDDIELIGSGPGMTIIDADDGYAALALNCDGVIVSGFTLTGAGSHGIYVKDGHHMIDHCLVYDNDDRGIYISNMFGEGSAEIEYCTIVDNEVSGIYSVDDNDDTEISYCIIARNGRGIVSDANEGGMTIEYNVLDNETENFDRVPEGEGNIVDDPGFLAPHAGDYHLEAGSPAIDIDGMGNNAGCF